MKNYLKSVICCFALACVLPMAGWAQPATTVVVRAKAKNAKLIGDEMSGADVFIINEATGDTLAQGLTEGSTGDTKRLVINPRKRYEKLSTPGAAKFTATLHLKKPTLATIRVTANAHNASGRITASTQQWLIPGEDITGDGIMLEIPGFAMHNQLPKANATYRVGHKVPIKTKIVMMCGCSTQPGGLWDSSEYHIKARINKEGKLIKEVPLSYSGQTSLFKASFKPHTAGTYHVLVYAFNPQTQNTGVAKTTIIVHK